MRALSPIVVLLAACGSPELTLLDSDGQPLSTVELPTVRRHAADPTATVELTNTGSAAAELTAIHGLPLVQGSVGADLPYRLAPGATSP